MSNSYNEAELKIAYNRAFLEDRKDLTFIPFISVDALDTSVIEDAFFLIANKETKGYTIFVAINDVTSYIKKNTPIDNLAKKRPSSSRMIPSKVTLKYGSFRKYVPQVALVCKIEISSKGEVLDVALIKAKCICHSQFTFGELKELLENKKLVHQNLIDIHTLKLTHAITHLLRIHHLSDDREVINNSLKREEDIQMHLSPEEIVRTLMSFVNVCVANYTMRNAEISFVRPAPDVISKTYCIKFSEKHFHKDESDNLYYCDFTSPLRKFSGMVTHRIVKNTLSSDEDGYTKEELEEIREKIEKNK